MYKLKTKFKGNKISKGGFFYDLDWTLKENEINEMKVFLELWAKSGANPHNIVLNKCSRKIIKNFLDEYIKFPLKSPTINEL